MALNADTAPTAYLNVMISGHGRLDNLAITADPSQNRATLWPVRPDTSA